MRTTPTPDDDVNILVYASNAESDQHTDSRVWLDGQLSGSGPGDRGRGPVYVRSTSDRVEILCTAAKDAKCQEPTYAVQQILSAMVIRSPRQRLRAASAAR